MTAARATLDEEHEPFKSDSPLDNNSYVLGRISEHNVVIACLPAGVHGNNAAATVAQNMLRTFTGLRFGLMVGIGGGIPNLEKDVDIRLGDVVVSQPDKTHGGVVQYDLGKNLGEGEFERKGFLRPPPTLLLTALSNLQSKHDLDGSQIPEFLAEMIKRHPNLIKSGYGYPGPGKDCLYCSHHKSLTENSQCLRCQDGVIQREDRDNQNPAVHYGVVASGNELIKNAAKRDRLSEDLGAKCVEMEAAGLMNEFPCIVIRGICDYADAYKNDVWQKYAATTAAAFAKELLSVIKPTEVASTKHAADMMKYNLGLNLFDAPEISEHLFIGRETEIRKVEEILQPGSKILGRQVLVVGGLGGIGKTQLVITYTKIHQNSYSSTFWLNATSEATLNNSLRDVASRIGISETTSKLDDDQVRVRILNWLSETQNRQWLLVFDNHDDVEQYDIKKYYPYASQGSIIITTRTPELLGGSIVYIEKIHAIEDSLLILSSRSGRDEVQADPQAQELAAKMDGLPLALATAGAYLRQSAISFADYLQSYRTKWSILQGVARDLPEYRDRTLYTTWDLSFEKISRQDPSAANLLKILAYFDNKEVWYALLAAGRDPSRPPWFNHLTSDELIFEGAIRTLVNFCLVEVHATKGSYGLHTCVHDWVMDALNRPVDPGRYIIAFDCVVNLVNTLNLQSIASIQDRRQLAAHAIRLGQESFCSLLAGELWANKYSDIVDVANLLSIQNKFEPAERLFIRALAGYEKILGHLNPETLGVVQNLGSLYRSRGKLDDAERMWTRALAGYEKALEPDHPGILGVIQNLGLLYHSRGKLDDAEGMWTQALAGYEKALEPDHPDTLMVVQNLGMLYHSRGKLDDAERMWNRALAGYEKALEPDHPDTLMVVQNLGMLYHSRGKLDDAERMWNRALAGYEKALEPDHPDMLMVAQNLGTLYNIRGKLDDAERMWTQALAGFEKALEPDHPSTLKVVQNLGLLYYSRGNLDDAEMMWNRALAGFEKALEPDHPDTLMVVQNLGMLYHSRGKLDDAERMWNRALAGYEKALEPDHPDMLMVAQNLGTLYNIRGKLDDAERMWTQALAGFEKALEPDHPSTLKVVQNLGLLYYSRGNLDDAEMMWNRALAGFEKALEPDHPDTLMVVQNLGLLYHSRGKLDDAERMWNRALAGYEKALEPDHPDTLLVVQNLGLLYHSRGKLDDAERMWNRALAGYEKGLEPDHPDTLMVVQNLGMLYYSCGKLDDAERMLNRALAGYEKALEPDHPDTLMVVQNLGMFYHSRGKLNDAEIMWTRALAGYERGLGADHSSAFDAANSLGDLFFDQGNLVLAEQMYQRALTGYENSLGPDHEVTLTVVDDLSISLLRRSWNQAHQSRKTTGQESDILDQLIKLALTWGSRSVSIFGILGRTLLWTADELNAQIAFQQQIKLHHGTLLYAGVQCDGCLTSLSCVMKRFICKHCPNIDLCGQCIERLKAGTITVAGCSDHSFLEVSPGMMSRPSVQLFGKPAGEFWLQNLKRTYSKG